MAGTHALPNVGMMVAADLAAPTSLPAGALSGALTPAGQQWQLPCHTAAGQQQAYDAHAQHHAGSSNVAHGLTHLTAAGSGSCDEQPSLLPNLSDLLAYGSLQSLELQEAVALDPTDL